MQQVAIILPFCYMISFPVEVLTNQLDGAGLQRGFMLQVAWLVIALILSVTLWHSGLRRYSTVGG